MSLGDERGHACRRVTGDFMTAIRHASTSGGYRDAFRFFTGIDVPPAERWVLHALHTPGLVPSADVARVAEISMAALSRAVARLERAGWVVRIDDPRDRRRTLLGLTDPGQGAMDRWEVRWPMVYLEAVRGWSDPDIRCLTSWFQLLIDQHPALTWSPLHVASRPHNGRQLSALEAFEVVVKNFVPVVGRSAAMDAYASDTQRDISRTGLGMLLTLGRTGEMTTKTLAAAEDLDLSLTVRNVHTLVKAGLATRSRRPEDGRGWLVSVTGDGRALIERSRSLQTGRVPEVPRHLIDAGLARLVPIYVEFIQSSYHMWAVRRATGEA